MVVALDAVRPLALVPVAATCRPPSVVAELAATG